MQAVSSGMQRAQYNLTLILLLAIIAQVRGGQDISDVSLDGQSAASPFENDPLAFHSYLLELTSQGNSNLKMELVEGVTVDDLVKLNHTNPGDCTRANMFKRYYTCDMVREVTHIRDYCLKCIDRSVHFCAKQIFGQNPGQFFLVQRPIVKINRKLRMDRLDKALWAKVLEIPEGNITAMVQHLDSELVLDEAFTRDINQEREYALFPDERISVQQFLKRLESIPRHSDKEIAIHLSQVKDKSNAILVANNYNDVTVADLLEMNEFSKDYCNYEPLVKRNKKCYATKSLKLNMRFFCRFLIKTQGFYCMQRLENAEDFTPWSLGLIDILVAKPEAGYAYDMFAGQHEFKTLLEDYLDKDPSEAAKDYVKFVEEAQRKARREKKDEKQKAEEKGEVKRER